MSPTLTALESTEEIGRLGPVDLVVGLPAVGAAPGTTGVARAIRAALDGRLAGHAAAFVQVDPAPSPEATAELSEALGPCPVLQLAGSGLPTARGPGEAPGADEAVRAVLEVGRQVGARAVLVLDPGTVSPEADDVAALAEAALKEEVGLVLPCFDRGRHEGTLTHALVVPLVRALFGRRVAYPMAREFACSGTAATALLAHGGWGSALSREGLEFWIPVAAFVDGLLVSQVLLGPRTATPARPAALGPTVGRVAGSLFALAERYEGAWLDVRESTAVPTTGRAPEIVEGGGTPDPERMLAGFRLGVRDLLAVWERILAPENLTEILDLSDASIEDFRLSDRLWARVVYDFLLGYRFRVVYRTHLVQSLAPLYLGRAASVVLATRNRPPAAVAEAADRLGQRFESEKTYLVERWQ